MVKSIYFIIFIRFINHKIFEKTANTHLDLISLGGPAWQQINGGRHCAGPNIDNTTKIEMCLLTFN
jgi:hypothetical protein